MTTLVTTPQHEGADRLDQLAVDLDGFLARPGDASWDVDRTAWNLAVDQRPVAVVHAESARDVQATVRTAGAAGLRVAPQSTGHNATPLGDLAGTILLRTSRMREVTIDPVRQVARAEGGAIWHDVTEAAAEHGLVALAGSAHDVGVVGYTLGGGVSWLARSHGLSANSVTAIEVVTADGEHRRVDADHDADLFWALRGGGGAFAVVTAIEFRLYPVTHVYAGTFFFPIVRSREVLHTWRRWVRTVPDEVMSIGRILRFPPLPEIPEPVRGSSFVVVELAATLPAAAVERLVAPFRALGPAFDTLATIPARELSALHMDPPGPVPGIGDGFLLDELTREGVEAMVGVAGPGVDIPLLSVELRHLGGALTPGRAENGGAVDGLDAAFLGFAVGFVPVPELAPAVTASVAAVREAMGPWSTGGCYLNFAESSRTGFQLFGQETYDRLCEVKATHDPEDRIRSNHPVAPRKRAVS